MWNSPEYLNDLFDYKSNRREILMNSINEFYQFDALTFNKVTEAFESLHFAVTTVDDIIDNETFRNEKPCFYVRKGYDQSVIASFSTFINFLEISSSISVIDKNIVSNLRDMLMTEEADIGLRKREQRTNPIDWYLENCCTKSSYEFLAIINLANNISPSIQIESIRNLFFEIGRLAQMTNDTRDLITNEPLARYSTTDTIKLTYNLPLAIYINNIDLEYENKIGLNITRNEFLDIHEKLNTKYVIGNIKTLLENQMNKIIEILKTNHEFNQPFTRTLITKIFNSEFYKRLNTYEILSK